MRSIFKKAAALCCTLIIANNTHAQSWAWAKSAGGSGIDGANYLATDASGNSYVTGSFSSPTMTFGSITVSTVGSDDIFLAKYDANGNAMWVRTAGSTGGDYGYGVTVDGNGDVYICGFFFSPSITFGTTTLTRTFNTGIFLAKYDAAGNSLWAVLADGAQGLLQSSVTTDASGHVYLSGCFNSPTLTAGSIVLNNAFANSGNMFLVKYDGAGNALWAVNAGCTTQAGSAGSNKITCDPSGNIIVTGYYGYPSVTIGPYTLNNADASSIDMFVAKYDAAGNVLWAKSGNGTGDNNGTNVVTDASGNSYVTGYFYTTNTFNSFSVTSAGASDLFLAKYDAAGNELWVKSFGGAMGDYGAGLCSDYSGNILMAGYFKSDTLWLGSNALVNDSAGQFDCFIAKFDANGNAMWAKSTQGKRDDRFIGITALSNGDIYSAGVFKSAALTAGTTVLTNASTGFLNDMVLVKLNDLSTGSAALNMATTFSLFPNPSTGQVTLHTGGLEENGLLIVVEAEGKLVSSEPVPPGDHDLSLQGLAPGIYFVSLRTSSCTRTVKLVITHP